MTADPDYATDTVGHPFIGAGYFCSRCGEAKDWHTTFRTVEEKIDWLTQHGSSLVLNWAEEGTWECEWITGGKRYRGIGSTLALAIKFCIDSTEEK